MPLTSSSFSTGCTLVPNIRGTESAWPSARRSSSSMAEGFGWNRTKAPDRFSNSPYPRQISWPRKRALEETQKMNPMTQVLLVDDNSADTDLTSEALAQCRWPSHVRSVSDGEQAMAFLHREGKYANEIPP